MSSDSAHVAGGDAPAQVVEDFGGLVQLLSDGTVIRRPDTNVLPPLSFPHTSSVQWKDVIYDPNHDLKLRIYKPATTPAAAAAEDNAADGEVAKKKLPVLVFFHGGGFCVGSLDLPNIHACCLRLAGELPALVLSADYRLAPENRLPAALDDARTLVSWIRAQSAVGVAGPWLAESADFGNVFVTGESAGGNIAHHVAVAVGSGEHRVDDSVHVAGCVLFWPFFAGVQRTASEAEYPPGPLLTLPVSDQLCRLSLPAGETRDHPALNPFGPRSPALDAVALPPTLVVAAEHDLLRDRAVDYVAKMKAKGKPLELVEFEGQHHGFFVVDPYGDAGNELIRVVRRFVNGIALPV